MPTKRSAPEKLGPVISRAGRAISYQRVSTQGQATEEKSSFERQQESFEAWCAAHPEHPPLETYRVARSGAEAGRFDWLMDGVKRGDFMPGDVLVVESINRFGREAMADTLENLFDIWKTGIKTAFCDHRDGQIFDKSDFNSDQSTIFLLAGKITAARDLYLDRKKWSKGAVNKKNQAVYDGRLNDSYFKPREPGKRALYSFWLDYHPEDNKGRGGFRCNNEVRWIRRMFQLALEDGQNIVAQKLNAEGYRTATGQPVDGTTIGNLLNDKKVMGWWWPTSQVKDPKTGKRKNVPVGPIKRDTFAVAVPETLFYAVQRKIAERRNNAGTPNAGGGRMLNLFAGHMFCFHCGGLVRRYGQAQGYKPKLRCSVSRRDKNSCSHRGGITYDEGQLLDMIQGFRWEEFFRDERKGEEIAQITEQQTQAQEQLNAANQEVDDLVQFQRDWRKSKKRAWPDEIDDDMDQAKEAAAEAQAALDRLSAQLADVSRQKKGKEATEAVQQRLRDFACNSDDVGARQEFNDWFASTGLVFVLSPEIYKLDPKHGISLGIGSVEAKGKQRRLAGFEAASEFILAGMQGDVHELEREDYQRRLEQFRKTGVMEELEESDDLTPEEFHAALKKHFPWALPPEPNLE